VHRFPVLRRRARLARIALPLVLLALLARSADAHTALRRSTPAKGATLMQVPRVLRLVFTEEVALTMSSLHLIGPDSQEVALGALAHPGDSASVIGADITRALRAGRYVVRWQTAGEDGHPVLGELAFTIAEGAAGLAPPAAAPPPVTAAAPDTTRSPRVLPPAPAGFDVGSPLFAAVRWLDYVALFTLIGAVIFRFAVLTRASRGDPSYAATLLPTLEADAARLGLGAAITLIVVLLLELLGESAAAHGFQDMFVPSFMRGMLGSTAWGFGWMVRFVAALVALVGFVIVRRGAREGALQGWGFAALAALASVIGQPYMGHSAAAPSYRGLALLADGLHVLGAGGWLGTLLVLAVVGLAGALRLDPSIRGTAAGALVRAFSPVALSCAGLVLLTGLFASAIRLGSFAALAGSRYGVTLLVKLALVVLVASVGAFNWKRLTPRLTNETAASDIRRSALRELTLGALVIAITAVLVTTPPPAYADASPADAQPTSFDRTLDSLMKR
jgi:putative copper export protein/methionine-rich copper-binding protein CopC